MIKKTLAIISFILVIVPSIASADKLVWRDCGIGGMIFQDISWAAIISNIIWDLGTTATSSNVSSPDTCMGKSAQAAAFIHGSYANLMDDTVVGEGKHLVSLLNIMDCSESAHPGIIKSMREGIPSILEQHNYMEQPALIKSENYYNLMNQTIINGFSNQCSS
jgi:Protein of unknown function (DUF3015).